MEAISDLDSIEQVIEKIFGSGVIITGRRSVSGGDINLALLLELSDGRRCFLKENDKRNAGFFSSETEGLNAIAKTKLSVFLKYLVLAHAESQLFF